MLPDKLFKGYKKLKSLKLTDKSDAKDFEEYTSVLNDARPVTEEEVAMYKIVRNMFNSNTSKFLSFIRGGKMECLIMWTDSRTITTFMRLRDIAYVKWDKTNSSYTVSKFERRQ